MEKKMLICCPSGECGRYVDIVVCLLVREAGLLFLLWAWLLNPSLQKIMSPFGYLVHCNN